MTPELMSLLDAFLVKASQENVLLSEIFDTIHSRVTPRSSEWNADGTSKPDARGLIRFKALEEFKAQLIAAGQTKAAALVFTWWACIPGRNQITDKVIKDQIDTCISWAGFKDMAIGVAGHVFKFEVVERDLGGVENRRIEGQYVEDAYSLDLTFGTVDKCVAEVKRRVKQWLDDESVPHVSGVDFSPLPPRG